MLSPLHQHCSLVEKVWTYIENPDISKIELNDVCRVQCKHNEVSLTLNLAKKYILCVPHVQHAYVFFVNRPFKFRICGMLFAVGVVSAEAPYSVTCTCSLNLPPYPYSRSDTNATNHRHRTKNNRIAEVADFSNAQIN